MATKFEAAEFVKEVTLGRLKGLVKAQLKDVATHLGVDVSQCTKKKEIFDVIVNHLGLDKDEHEVGETDRKEDDTKHWFSVRIG